MMSLHAALAYSLGNKARTQRTDGSVFIVQEVVTVRYDDPSYRVTVMNPNGEGNIHADYYSNMSELHTELERGYTVSFADPVWQPLEATVVADDLRNALIAVVAQLTENGTGALPQDARVLRHYAQQSVDAARQVLRRYGR